MEDVQHTANQTVGWWHMLWASPGVFISWFFREKIKETILGWFKREPRDETHPAVLALRHHEHDDNRRFDELKEFIRDSENRTISAVEGNSNRLESAIKETNTRTDKRFESFEKMHQDLLFRYMDIREK